MKISIFASIGCQNLGDELILKNEISLLKEKYGNDTEFRVFTYDTKDLFFTDEYVTYLEYFPIGITSPKNIFRNIKNCFSFFYTLCWSDLVVIGGWGIFYENEKQSVRPPLDMWNYRMKCIKFLWKKVLFCAVWVDVSSDIWKKKLKHIFRYKKAQITLRDAQSFFLLQELWIQSEVVQDPVFFDTNQNEKGGVLFSNTSEQFNIKSLSRIDFQDKKVGIALRKWFLGKTKNEHLEKLMIEEILSHIESKWGKIVLLPHSFHKTDILANDFVFLSQFLKEGRSISESMYETYNIYLHKEIDICFSMRLHSIILSHIYGIDIVALSYSKKTEEVLKKLSN